MEERLKKIELRAKMLGWRCETVIEGTKDHPHYVVKFWVVKDVPEFDDWLVLTGNTATEAAERLLSLYEDGPMVKIEHYISRAPDKCARISWYVNGIVSRIASVLADRYPPPGDYKVVRWDDAE